jgi:MFS family permease
VHDPPLIRGADVNAVPARLKPATMGRYQWTLVALLSANFGVVFFDRNVFSYLTSFIQPDLHLSNFQIGKIASGFSFSWAIAGLRMGIAEGGIMPITQTLIAAEVPHARRGLAQGITQNFGANLLANTLGPLLIVRMAIHFGWRNAFFLAALPGIVMAALIALMVREPDMPVSLASATDRGLADLISDRTLVLCIAISTLLVAYLMVLFTFAPLYLIRVRGFDVRHMSWIMSSFGVASMAVAFLVPGASDRFGRRPVTLAAAALGLVLPLGLLFAGGTGILPLIACIAMGSALSGAFPLAMATIPSEIVPPAKTATALALTMGISEIVGGVAAPSAAGWLADTEGLRMTIWILVGLVSAIIVLAALLKETAPAVLAQQSLCADGG